MTTFSKAKQKISRDWQAALPSFSLWKPGQLVRRHGPLLEGVCLDARRDLKVYAPIFHFHCLCVPSDELSLLLSTPALSPGGSPREVRVDRHAELVAPTAAALVQAVPFLRAETLEYADHVDYTRRFVAGEVGNGSLYSPGNYESVVLTAAALGRAEYAARAVDGFVALMRTWDGWDQGAYQVLGSPERWGERMRARIADPEDLRRVIAAEVDRHGLGALPDHGISAEKTPTWP